MCYFVQTRICYFAALSWSQNAKNYQFSLITMESFFYVFFQCSTSKLQNQHYESFIRQVNLNKEFNNNSNACKQVFQINQKRFLIIQFIQNQKGSHHFSILKELILSFSIMDNQNRGSDQVTGEKEEKQYNQKQNLHQKTHQNQHLQSQEQEVYDEQSDQNSESNEQYSELKQKPAFQLIEEMNQDSQFYGEQQLDEDEKNAFLYLFHVRKQKKILKKQKKQAKSQTISQISLGKNEQSPNQSSSNNQNNHKQDPLAQIANQNLINFRKQLTESILVNFNIVIKNIQFLIKTNESLKNNNKKFNTKLYQSIKLEKNPQIYQLMRLTLGQVQDAMRKVCNQMIYGTKNKKMKNYHKNEEVIKKQENIQKQVAVQSFNNQPLNEVDQQMQAHVQIKQSSDRLYNFSLWIYSLLSLHQGWSSYINFQSLGQINAVLMKQTQINRLMKLTEKQTNQALVLFVIMVNVFKQRHLQKNMQNLINKSY